MEKQKGAKRYKKIDSSSSKKHKSGINPNIIQPIKTQSDAVRSFPKKNNTGTNPKKLHCTKVQLYASRSSSKKNMRNVVSLKKTRPILPKPDAAALTSKKSVHYITLKTTEPVLPRQDVAASTILPRQDVAASASKLEKIHPTLAKPNVAASTSKEKIARKPLKLRFVKILPDPTLLSSKKSDYPMYKLLNTTQVCTPKLLHAPETEASSTTRVRTPEISHAPENEILEWQFSEPSTRVNQTTNLTMGESMLQTGHVVKNKWQVVSKIGQGAFGEVYKCKDFTSNRQVALKLVSKERVTSTSHLLKLEIKVLKELQGKPYFPKFLGFGKTERFDYLVMELLGPSLRELKKHQPHRKFSLSTTLRLGHMMLKSIHSIHNAGYLHRDIKPSNFTIGIGEDNRRRVYLLDFGLARQYVLENGEVRPPRYKVSFHGTPRYASLRVLQGKEAGRQDDLMSLFYTLSEFSFRDLPWKNIRDFREMAQAKEVFDHQILVKEFPDEFQDFYNHICGLTFFDQPDYDLLYSVFDRCIKRLGVKETDPFDFEENGGQPTESHLRKDNTSSVPTKRRRYRIAATSLASMS